MKTIKNKVEPTNQFEIEVDGHLSSYTARPILEWLNIQHTGSPQISLDTKVRYKKEHVEATHLLFAGRKIKLTIQIDKRGNWNIIKVNGKKVEK
jgi:hypothetical protein